MEEDKLVGVDGTCESGDWIIMGDVGKVIQGDPLAIKINIS